MGTFAFIATTKAFWAFLQTPLGTTIVSAIIMIVGGFIANYALGEIRRVKKIQIEQDQNQNIEIAALKTSLAAISATQLGLEKYLNDKIEEVHRNQEIVTAALNNKLGELSQTVTNGFSRISGDIGKLEGFIKATNK